MAITITIVDFIANKDKIEIGIEASGGEAYIPDPAATINDPTLIVEFVLTDGSVVLGEWDGVQNPVLRYFKLGDFSDGIYEAIATFTVPGDPPQISTDKAYILNQKVSNECLLSKVLKGEYDCKLMQDISVVETLFLAGEIDLARELYESILAKCTTCSDLEQAALEGISVWIVDDDFIVQ